MSEIYINMVQYTLQNLYDITVTGLDNLTLVHKHFLDQLNIM